MTARKIEKRPWTEEELQRIRMAAAKGSALVKLLISSIDVSHR
jgi:hypothetical protein